MLMDRLDVHRLLIPVPGAANFLRTEEIGSERQLPQGSRPYVFLQQQMKIEPMDKWLHHLLLQPKQVQRNGNNGGLTGGGHLTHGLQIAQRECLGVS